MKSDSTRASCPGAVGARKTTAVCFFSHYEISFIYSSSVHAQSRLVKSAAAPLFTRITMTSVPRGGCRAIVNAVRRSYREAPAGPSRLDPPLPELALTRGLLPGERRGLGPVEVEPPCSLQRCRRGSSHGVDVLVSMPGEAVRRR